jgi:hypothetical protein
MCAGGSSAAQAAASGDNSECGPIKQTSAGNCMQKMECSAHEVQKIGYRKRTSCNEGWEGQKVVKRWRMRAV